MPPFATDRLLLRKPTEDDIGPMDAMDADPEVMRYIGNGKPRVPGDGHAAAAVERMLRAWDERGYAGLTVIVRETGEYAGWVTLSPPEFLPEVMPAVEIGWRMPRPVWGRGYATEAGREMLRFAFRERGLDRLVSIRHVDNVRSGRVMGKLGLRFEFETTVPAYGVPAAVHAITRAEYGS